MWRLQLVRVLLVLALAPVPAAAPVMAQEEPAPPAGEADVPGATLPAPAPDAAPAPHAQAAPGEVVVYASDLAPSALYEFDFWDDPAAPGGRLVGTPNNGDELDPPPENDPHVTFTVPVQGGVPYRCWIRIKVGTPRGKSRANLVWVQFSEAVDQGGREILKPGTGSYLTARAPERPGWTWVACDAAAASSASLIYFRTSGEVTVRVQAGMEGVGFDQILVSPARFLQAPPAEAVVPK